MLNVTPASGAGSGSTRSARLDWAREVAGIDDLTGYADPDFWRKATA
jgi:hypothetical protein